MIRRVLAMTMLALFMAAAPARADITAFLGTNTTPDNRLARGVALGFGLLIVGFEFEYSATSESANRRRRAAPSLKTGMGNVLLQTPVAISGLPAVLHGRRRHLQRDARARATTWAWAEYRWRRRRSSLAGPVRLRVDYRVFKQGSGALYSPAHRIYAGLNLKF